MISNDILGISNPFYRLMPESVSNIVLPASSPSTLRSAYDRGSMAGVIVDAPEAPWYVRQAARYDFDALADLRDEPLLFEESAVYRDIAGKHKDRPRVLQWHDYLRMSPKAMSGAQKTGDCVSWAIRCVREILRTLRIGKGVWEAFIERQATCGIYSGRGHTGQGASPTRLTAYAIAIGTLLEKVYKTASKTYDFREYSDYVRWGMSRGRVGMPDDLLEHTRHATDDRWYVVRDPEAVADAMAADFVVHCGSSIGVSSSGDFVSSLRGSWSHDMALCGYDISQEFTRDKIFAWDQSWGNWNRLTNVPSAYQPLGQGMFFLTWNSSQRGFSRGGTCVIVPGSYFEAEVDNLPI